MSKASSFLPILIIYLLLFLGRTVGGKKKKADAQSDGRTPAQTGARTAQTAVPEKRNTKPVHWHSEKKDECLYGEVNHQYSHSSEKRVAQLKGYLQAGLIDRKEYGEMLERYTRMDREAGLY